MHAAKKRKLGHLMKMARGGIAKDMREEFMPAPKAEPEVAPPAPEAPAGIAPEDVEALARIVEALGGAVSAEEPAPEVVAEAPPMPEEHMAGEDEVDLEALKALLKE